MQSGDGVKRPILQFKEDQGDRYERYRIRYDQQISIYFFSTGKFFDSIYFKSIFSQPTVSNVSVACWLTGYQQPNMGAIVHYCPCMEKNVGLKKLIKVHVVKKGKKI